MQQKKKKKLAADFWTSVFDYVLTYGGAASSLVFNRVSAYVPKAVFPFNSHETC